MSWSRRGYKKDRGVFEMNRLPIKFEEEVLSKHGNFGEWDEYYKDYLDGNFEYLMPKHEIAGIALEVMRDVDRFNNKGDFLPWALRFMADMFVSEDDFCECVFKAVNEIWNDTD